MAEVFAEGSERIAPFSDGFERVLIELDPGNRPNGALHFPRGWTVAAGRLKQDETVHQWFRRGVDEFYGREPLRFAVEQQLALFVSVIWETKGGSRHLTYLSCQALVAPNTDSDLEVIYKGKDARLDYFRLDYNRGELGPLFSHPVPHVHVRPDGPPRIPMEPLRPENAPIDFVEFLYRNYFRDDWVRWAHAVWRRRMREAGIEDDLFDLIARSFRENQYELLRGHADTVSKMKTAWGQAKRQMHPLRIESEYCDLLRYG